MLVTGTALSDRKNRPSVCTRPLSRTANFPSADLMLKPSLRARGRRDLVLGRRGGAVRGELPQSLKDPDLLVQLIHPASSDALSGRSRLLLRHGLWRHRHASRMPEMMPPTQYRTARIRLPP